MMIATMSRSAEGLERVPRYKKENEAEINKELLVHR
jgi:hypothetical protein